MKKVLLTLITVLMAVPAFAIEVYNNGEGTSVDIYGTIRGYVGYGHSTMDDSVDTSATDDFLYGLQGNSRIGTKFKVGNFAGQVELGANENTLTFGQGKVGVGLRQVWGSYTFGNAGTFVAGKTDTPTSMSGFSSDIMDTDGGLNGFGGNSTSNRRFQMAYRVMGLDIAIIENDMSANKGNVGGSYFAGYEKKYVASGVDSSGNPTYTITDDTNKPIYNAIYKDGGEVIPRIAISYTYKNPSLMAKVGATYSALNGRLQGPLTDPDTRWTTIHAFGIVAGVKPTFMDGKMWLAVQARYGMNEELYGEVKTVYNGGTFGHTSVGTITSVDSEGTVYNTSRVNVGLELGYKVTEAFSAILGGGYQLTMNEVSGFENINSYGAYVQIPYAVSKNFSLIPQISYFGTSQGDLSSNAVLLVMQARFTF